MRKFIIKTFVKSICPDIKVEFGDFNECDEDTIYLNPKEYVCPGFKKHLKEKHGCDFGDKFSQQLWSILHEIGHMMTNPPEDEDMEMLIRLTLETTVDEDEYNTDENLQYSYYDLESEYNATQWAIDYISIHWLKCRIISLLLH